MRRVFVAGLTALLLATQTPTAAAARDEVHNTAVASVTEDGDTELRFAWALDRVNGPDVAATNVAVATASCKSCRSAALAFQVVLASRVTGKLAPTNLAVARNDECIRCETLAIAYQFVVASDGKIQLAPGVRAELVRIRIQLRWLVHHQAPNSVLEARADQLAAQIVELLTQVTTRHVGVLKTRRGIAQRPA